MGKGMIKIECEANIKSKLEIMDAIDVMERIYLENSNTM